jgi:hypothetical protein
VGKNPLTNRIFAILITLNAPQQRRNLIRQSICNNVIVDRLITCAALITNLCIFNGNWTKKYYVGYDIGSK